MATIRAIDVLQKIKVSGRLLGNRLGEEVRPGDVVDFSGGPEISNSVVDSFVRVFVQNHGKEAFSSLNFLSDGKPLFPLLLEKARKGG